MTLPSKLCWKDPVLFDIQGTIAERPLGVCEHANCLTNSDFFFQLVTVTISCRDGKSGDMHYDKVLCFHVSSEELLCAADNLESKPAPNILRNVAAKSSIHQRTHQNTVLKSCYGSMYLSAVNIVSAFSAQMPSAVQPSHARKRPNMSGCS